MGEFSSILFVLLAGVTPLDSPIPLEDEQEYLPSTSSWYVSLMVTFLSLNKNVKFIKYDILKLCMYLWT